MARLAASALLALLCAAHAAIDSRPAVPVAVPGLPTMDELTRAAGVVASHWLVTTEDGYQVMLHRLGNNTGPPIYFQHGLLNAADIWLTRGKDYDLVYMFLDQGYDVYLGNMRGTVFSKFHTRLRTNDVRYWDFSFHESGYYDVPAMIDWILQFRGVDQLFYIGHSLGTTVFFVMTSTRPEYNDKIKAAGLMSPVAFVPYNSEFAVSFIRPAIQHLHFLYNTFTKARLLEFMPRTTRMVKSIYDFCGYQRPTQDFCLDLYGIYLGEHRANIDRKMFAYYLSFSPTGTSFNTVYHLGQLFQSEDFRQLDLGPAANLAKYNSTVAPAYPLERITAPIILFWSYNDHLVSERSMNRIMSRLQNVVLKVNPDPKFTHSDPFMGINAKEVLYGEVVDTFNKLR